MSLGTRRFLRFLGWGPGRNANSLIFHPGHPVLISGGKGDCALIQDATQLYAAGHNRPELWRLDSRFCRRRVQCHNVDVLLKRGCSLFK